MDTIIKVVPVRTSEASVSIVSFPGKTGPTGPTGVSGLAGPVGPTGPIGDSGAGVQILGSRASESDLPTNSAIGDGYLVVGLLYIWTGTEWSNVGSVSGPTGGIGPTGPQGIPGISSSVEYLQINPLATWILVVPEGFGRTPSVDVFLSNGEKVITDVIITNLSVTIVFASPVAGSAVLT